MTMVETSHRGGNFWEEQKPHHTRFTAALASGQKAVGATIDFRPDFEIPEPTFVPLRHTVDTTPSSYEVHMRAETEEEHILGRD